VDTLEIHDVPAAILIYLPWSRFTVHRGPDKPLPEKFGVRLRDP